MTKRKVPKFMILRPAHHRVPVLNEPEPPPSVEEDLSEKTNPEWHNTSASLSEDTSVIDMNAFAMFWDREKTPVSGHSMDIAKDIKKEMDTTQDLDPDIIDASVFEEN